MHLRWGKLSFNEFAGTNRPRATNSKDSIISASPFANFLSFIRYWISGAARRVRDRLLFVTIRFHCNAEQLLKFMLAAITFLLPRAARQRRAIKFSPTSLWQAHLVFSPLRARLPSSVTLTSLWSGALRKFRIAFHSLFMPRHAKVRWIFAGLFHPPSVSVFPKRVSFLFFYRSRGFSVATQRRRNTLPMATPWPLPFDGKGRHSSRISSHLNGSGI